MNRAFTSVPRQHFYACHGVSQRVGKSAPENKEKAGTYDAYGSFLSDSFSQAEAGWRPSTPLSAGGHLIPIRRRGARFRWFVLFLTPNAHLGELLSSRLDQPRRLDSTSNVS